jgi:hypothetical protein
VTLCKKTLVHFVKSNGKRLLVYSDINQWSDIVEQATFMKSRVVVVNLTSALSCEHYELVL